MPPFVDVGSLDQLPEGSARAVTLGDVGVALFHVGERIYAVDDACPRCGASLAKGTLERTRVTCSCGWRYDVDKASAVALPALKLHAFDVRIENAHVLVATR